MTSVEQVRETLREVVDPCSAATGTNLDIVEMGLVKSIEVANSHVEVQMRLTSPMCHMVPYFVEEVEDRVGELPSVESVELVPDNGLEWTQDMMTEQAKDRRQTMLREQKANHGETRPVQ